MEQQPYQPPKSDVVSEQEKIEQSGKQKARRPPLSRATGKRKIFIALPVSIVFAFILGPTSLFTIVFGAYALVGFVEVLGGESLVSMTKRWDSLPRWKQNLLSLLVIILFLVLVIVLIPMIGMNM